MNHRRGRFPFAYITRLILATVLLIGVAVTMSLPAIASPAPQAPATQAPTDQGGQSGAASSDLGGGEPLPTQFAACAAAGGNIDVLILVDESGSLKQNDPNNARVTSGLHLVSQMSKLSSTGNLSVAVSGFGHTYDKVRDWQDIRGDSDIDALRSSINELANRTDGIDTDYWTALDEARKQLASKAGGGESNCQAIIWFSDGELDYEVRDGNKAAQYGDTKPFAPDVSLKTEDGANKVEDLAREDICRPGGLADQLRSSRVAMFGVGLGTTDGTQFDLMRSIATGKDNQGTTCGDLTDPVPGEFYLASDIDSLLFAFDSISGLGQQPITSDHDVCVENFCEDEAHTFVLDSTTLDVDGFATTSAAGLSAAIQGPDGKVVDLKQGAKDQQITVSGVPFTYTWETDRSLSFRLDGTTTGNIGDNGPWVGVWRLAFIAQAGQDQQATSKSNLHITPGILPAWPAKDQTDVRAGSKLDNVAFGITDRQGNNVPASKITSTGTFTATFTDSAGSQHELKNTTQLGTINDPVTWDLTGVPTGAGTLGLALELTTAPATDANGTSVPGTKLSPATVAIPITVQAPLNYPTVPTSVDFGQATGKVDLTTALKLGGSGCAWIKPDSTQVVASPKGMENAQVSADATGQDSCVQAGQDLTLRLTTDAQGNGAINGSFTVVTTPDNNQGDPIETSVTFTASATKPLNTFNFITTLIIALILGPGIPLLILYAVKWWGAKIPSQPLVAVRAQVHKTAAGVTRDGQRFAFQPGDMRNTVPINPGGSRRIDTAGVTLKTTMGGSPLGAGYVLVDVPGLHSVSHHDPARTPARLPLAVHNQWFVMRAADAPEEIAEVVVFLSGNIDDSSRTNIENQIYHQAGELMDRLPHSSQGAGDGAQASPFGAPSQPENPFGTFGQ